MEQAVLCLHGDTFRLQRRHHGQEACDGRSSREFPFSKGFTQLRVRVHEGNLARIEVLPGELFKLFKLHDEVSRVFKAIGFTYVTMDLLGYRMGSMDEVLSKDQLEM